MATPPASVRTVPSFTACIDERPWIPYTDPDLEKPGNMQITTYNVARDLQVRVDIVALPWKRCLENVKTGKTDAAIALGDVPYLRKIAEFPRVSGFEIVDRSRSLGTARIMLVKRRSSSVDWDGKSLSHLDKPVGTAMGTQVMKTAIERLGGIADDSARTDEQNLRKLLQNRVELMAGYEFDLKKLIRKSFQERVTVLDIPLIESHYFLAFSKQFYAKNAAFAEVFWNKIGTYQSGAYLKSLSREEFTSATPIRPH